MRSPRLLALPLLLCLLSAAAASAASGADETRLRQDLIRMSRPGSAEGFEPRSARGARGLAHILEGRALPLTLPLSAYRLLQGRQTLVGQWRAEGTIPSPFFSDDKVVLAHGDVLHEDEAGFPLVTKTCFTCHAGPVAGRLVAGLSNSQLDKVPGTALASRLEGYDLFRSLDAADPLMAVGQTMGPSSPGRVGRYVRYLRDYKAYVDGVLLPSYRHSTGRGDNTGALGAWFMMARMPDPEATGIVQGEPDDPRTAADVARLATESLPTVDPNPWWNIKFKQRAYRFWDAPGHAATDFNLNFFIPQRHVDQSGTLDQHVEKLRRRAALVAEALHFARETEPPRLPASLEADLVGRQSEVESGSRIFHGGKTASGSRQSCFQCHGTYQRTGEVLEVSYPNLGFQDVGTDPEYNGLLQRLAPLAEKLNRTAILYGKDLAPHSYPVTRRGYPAPVLVGVWASAPYFHNGSVPTLSDVLEPPARRPGVWGRNLSSPSAYDLARIGLAHDVVSVDELARTQAAAEGRGPRDPESIARRRLYDTRGFGRSNRGHPFGTGLAADEKRALIAFLSSLAPHAGTTRVIPAPAGGQP